MLKTSRIFLWLLPLFFVLHGANEYFGYLSLLDTSWLLVFYLSTLSLLAFLLYAFFKNFDKAALLSFVCGFFYFFFGPIQDGLKQSNLLHWISSYSILLPLLLALVVLVFVRVKKNNIAPSIKQYLNGLLLLLVTIDLGSISVKAWKQGYFSFNEEKNRAEIKDTYQTSAHPDIYFLLFDEFASPSSIYEQTGIRNNLDSFLQQQGFRVIKSSRSNYNFTPFSMASLLNMDYLQLVPPNGKVGLKEYNQCSQLIENNKVLNTLETKGYEISNYSIFNLKGYPTRISQSFLPLNTQLITANTLGARVRKDLGWMALQYAWGRWILEADFLRENRNNQLLETAVNEASKKQHDRPFFLYAHFMMPHTPYYYNEKGQLKDIKTVYAESLKHDVYSYAKYSLYASSKIKIMVKELLQQNPNACILLLGDHGFRNDTEKKRQFRNLNAVYFPDGDYASFPDSVTNVNVFRLVFNKIFREQQPMLKDSSIFLQDK